MTSVCLECRTSTLSVADDDTMGLSTAVRLCGSFHQVTNADEAGEHDEDDDYEVIELGDKRISIRTSVLEEKATACNMLYCYANELKEGFYPYVEPVMQLMLPLLKFYVHEEVSTRAYGGEDHVKDVCLRGSVCVSAACVRDVKERSTIV